MVWNLTMQFNLASIQHDQYVLVNTCNILVSEKPGEYY